MTRLCQSMRDGGTALLPAMDPSPGLETRVHSRAASPRQRSPPPSGEELPPRSPRPQELPPPTSASHALCLLTGPRLGQETASPRGRHRWRCAAKPGAARPAHLTTGAVAAPTPGCLRAADTHVWQEGEALGALSPPDRSGHTPQVCLATRPRGKIRLSRP